MGLESIINKYDFYQSNGFKTFASNRFGIYGKAFIECKRVLINGNREYRYFMKEGISFEDDDDIVDLEATVDVHV